MEDFSTKPPNDSLLQNPYFGHCRNDVRIFIMVYNFFFDVIKIYSNLKINFFFIICFAMSAYEYDLVWVISIQ